MAGRVIPKDVKIDMPSAPSCACEPTNASLCCDKVACCPTKGLHNQILEIRRGQEPSPTLDVHLTHLAGRMIEFFIPQSWQHCIFMPFAIVFIFPVVCLLSACCPVASRFLFTRQRENGSINGLVTQRSGCCTWNTPIAAVSSVKVVVLEDSEGPPDVFLHYASATGVAKMRICEGYVDGLEEAVNPWIRDNAPAVPTSAV